LERVAAGVTTIGPRELLSELIDAVDGGRPAVLATIVGTEGSVPRHAGSKMVVHPDGTATGTIGGGEVEALVRDEALAALKDRRPRLRRYTLNDPELGDPGICGGTMTIYLEPYMTPRTVYVIGAGHVGRSVVDLADWLGYRTVVVDDRADLVTEEGMPNASIRFAGSVADALEAHPADETTAVVVVTRSHELDALIVPILLQTPAPYIGVMGSKRRWATTRGALVESGTPVEALNRLHVPIGLSIGAETVEEIAVSIMSQVIESAAASDE
jgi:xanthine dehydrogenase accessory factor